MDAAEPTARARRCRSLQAKRGASHECGRADLPCPQLLVLICKLSTINPASASHTPIWTGGGQNWLCRGLILDPEGQYPLLMASHLYARVPTKPASARCESAPALFSRIRIGGALARARRDHREASAQGTCRSRCVTARRSRAMRPPRRAGRASMRIFLLADMGARGAQPSCSGARWTAGKSQTPRRSTS